jgi:branched-chain amino acid transport system ATP-binding protein
MKGRRRYAPLASSLGGWAVEQNAMSALEVADRAYVLANGVKALEGPAQSILEDPKVRRLYLGETTKPDKTNSELFP